MGYLGRNPAIGTQKVLDSLESQFNGSTTTFNLRYGGNPTYPTLSSSLIVSVGGVLQEPGEAYYVSSDTIVFSQAPAAGLDCWILLYSEYGAAAGGSSSGGAVSVATGEPMGHEDRTDSAISFDNATRTFTIAPASGVSEFVVWTKGTKRTYSTTQTIQIGTATGLYYIYFDAFGVLQYRTTYFDWDDDTPTAYVYWNATSSTAVFVADERHGIVLDWQTHEYLHRTRGAVIANGFGISNYTTVGDGSSDAHAQFDLANGTFFDEDLEVNITHSATPSAGTFTQVLTGAAEIPVYYMSGSEGDWVRDTATEFACKQSGTTLQYNSLSGSTWSTTAANDNRYVVSWVVATNEISAPVIAILGQEQYSAIGTAEEAVWGDLTLTNFPIFEFRPLWKVIFRTNSTFTNTPNAYIANVLDLREFSSTGIAGTIVSDHGLLSGLADDDHAQYLNTTVDRAGVTANITTTGDITAANLIATGQLQGPANFVIDPAAVGDDTGTVEIKGNLTVQGTTTTINSTTLTVDDKNIVLADGQSTLANIDTAGIDFGSTAVRLRYNYNSGTDSGLSIEGTNVGIGTVTPATSLDIYGDSRLSGGNRTFTISTGGAGTLNFAGGNSVIDHNSNQLQLKTTQVQGITFTTNNEERFRIDAAGNLRAYESGANGNSRTLSFEVYGGSAGTGGHGIIDFKRSRSSVAGVQSATVNDVLGQVKFSGSNGTSFVEGARIEARSYSAWSGTDQATDLIFHTTPDNSTILTEALRIRHNGNVGIGTNDPLKKLHILSGTSGYSITNSEDAYIVARFEAADSRVQIASADAGGNGSSLILSNSDKHWVVDAKAVDSSNRFDIGYYNSSVSNSTDWNQNKSTYFTIETAGNIGIGTTNPSQKLHVNGNTLIEGTIQLLTPSPLIDLKDSNNSGITTYCEIRGSNVNGAARWKIGQISTANEALYIYNYATDAIRLGTQGTGRLIIDSDGNTIPDGDDTYNLGSPTNRWANIYSADLQLSNEGSANDVDGTWGAYTIQEGEEELFLINRRSGKKFKFVLEEVK